MLYKPAAAAIESVCVSHAFVGVCAGTVSLKSALCASRSGSGLTPDREDASSMATAGATANTTEGNSRASRESGL